MKMFVNCALRFGLILIAVGPAFGAGQLKETIASPRSLPTDALPPFGMLDDSGKLIPLPNPAQLAAMLQTPPAGPPEPHVNAGISLDLATQAARAAVNACTKRGFLIAAAVVDAVGKPLALLAEEGSDGSVFVAMRKAATSRAFRLPSSKVGATIAQDKSMLTRLTPTMFIAGGALPLWRGKVLVGAIASSGAHGAGPIGTEDEICAQAGLDKIKGKLK
ncbi:MAG: heme-binding protein [Pseudomonadota bacterium]